MKETEKLQQRRKAAEYWSNHGIGEQIEDAEEVSVEVRKPLTAMLSVRLDGDDLSKLKLLARANQIGVTTMTRMLLHQCLEEPSNQLMLQALRTEGVRKGISEILEETKIPPGDGDAEFFVLSTHDLDEIGRLVNETALRLFVEALREQSRTVTHQLPELYKQLRELEGVKS